MSASEGRDFPRKGAQVGRNSAKRQRIPALDENHRQNFRLGGGFHPLSKTINIVSFLLTTASV
jgi:hypothetical protein